MKRLLPLAILGLSATTAIIWGQTSLPVEAPPVTLAEVPWKLPEISSSDAKKALAIITEHNLWGAVAAATPASLADPEWRFAGIMRNGNEHYLMISIENKPLTTLREGDELPGGSKILSIAEDHLCLLINGHKRKIGIYRQ